MRAVSTAASAARHSIGALAEAFLIAAIIAAIALSLSAVYKPAAFVAGVGNAQAARAGVSIAFANSAVATTSWPTVGDAVSFRVGTAGIKTGDIAKLWVANKCSQGGTVVYAQYLAVHDGLAGPFGLSWAGGGASCTAYVWMFPSSETPLKGASMSYTAD
jgi:hypothetical protein